MADPIDPRFAAQMNSTAAAPDEIFNGSTKPGERPKVGCALLTAEFDRMEGGRVNCISNGDRKDDADKGAGPCH